ncbi:MAG TPA: MerR family transcriptional regulator [Acidobacteriota bacterium]|nr:MerR family transcriptional regulator [Acidobacteriota bacterium]
MLSALAACKSALDIAGFCVVSSGSRSQARVCQRFSTFRKYVSEFMKEPTKCSTGLDMLQENDKKKVIQIGDLAKRAGISVRAVRYYEELDLIIPTGHSVGGFRLYDEENLKRLQVINFLKELGLTLIEIRKILLAKKEIGGDRETVSFLQRVFKEKLGLVEVKIRALSKMKNELSNALRILDSCQSCDHKVLLDAICCDSCASLNPRDTVPRTFEVILQ